MKRVILGLLTVFFLSVFTVPTLVSTVEQKPVRFEYRKPPGEPVHPSAPRRTFKYKAARPVAKPKASFYDMLIRVVEIVSNFFGVFTGIWFVIELIRKRRTKEA